MKFLKKRIAAGSYNGAYVVDGEEELGPHWENQEAALQSPIALPEKIE